MKKIILTFSLILILGGGLFSSVLAANNNGTHVSNHKSEERDVKNFNAVMSGGPIAVVITMGNTESLRFEGDADAIATLITEVIGNKLIIRPENSWTSWARKYQGKKITAYVTAKKLKSLAMSGDGSITVKGTIQASSFATALSGSGYITANIETGNYSGVISGSGNLNISGKADNASITISGSGSLTKKGLSVGDLNTVISGSGSVNIIANEHINAMISGSGSVNYQGSASVEKRVVGSGRVNKI